MFSIDDSWTLFLDRDGVINIRDFDGYITNVKDFKFIDGVKEAIQILTEKFARIIVVTNQQGVGKGIMSHETLKEIHDFMNDELSNKIDLILYAHHLKSESSEMRKPNSGMAFEAKKIYPDIDFEKSVMVGDTDSDLKFGKNLNMKTILVESAEICNEIPNMKVKNLLEFAQKI